MYNYIWCPYYLPSFMKFCSVVSEELRWPAASVVNFGKFLSSKGHNSHKIQGITISWQYAQLLKQLVSATPLKLLNRISWNLVGGKDTICSCAYYQEILIAWILWELCPFELKCFSEIYFWSSLSAQLLWNYWTEFGDQNFLVICTATYGVLTTYQVSWNSVQ
jgi:hypothetical protein